MKYADEGPAVAISTAPGYRKFNRAALSEMHRQVGHLRLDADGIALQGLIIRHLVLPEGQAGSRETLRWIREYLGLEAHIALMSQYFPAHAAAQTEGLNRLLTHEEYDRVVAELEEFGLENGWIQELDQGRGKI
jgi:putative pyruvate formate lyase activating enzyme